MILGSFGSVIFQVSAGAVETFNKLQLTQSVSYQGHKVHGGRTVQEFTGHDAAKLSMEITLSAFFGIDPKKELDKLEKLKNSKETCTLVLGTDICGKWYLQSVSQDYQHVYLDGRLMQCKVSLSMIEGE